VNWSATSSTARRGRSAADGVVPATTDRTGGPTGISVMPAAAASSAKSGGAHTSACTPSTRSCIARASNGSTSPRDPVRRQQHAHFDHSRSCGVLAPY
jgi:hypothetical protein